MRSASVDFPWSMWAMIEKFRMLLAGAATRRHYGGVLALLLAAAAAWTPAPTTEPWQYQLQGKVDLSVPATVYDIDGADNSAATVRAIHDQGARAVCYFSAGSYENWRDDKGRFPARVLGKPLDNWPGERWLDIRERDALIPIMRDRMRMCADKGFDAVEPDNVDGYQNDSGFPLTGRQQVRYNRALARRGPCARARDRAEERPRAGAEARRQLRLRGQRVVLRVRRVRAAAAVR